MTTVRKPQDGDILIQCYFGDDPDCEHREHYTFNKLEATVPEEQWVQWGDHIMVYKDNEAKPEIHHCGSGGRMTGVKKNNLFKAISGHKGQSLYIPYVGSYMVLHCKQESLRKNLMSAAENWTVDLKKVLGLEEKATEEQVEAVFKEKRLKMPTIWNLDRKADAQENAELFELYRAFRAYERNKTNPATALSKKQGVSCDEFVFYVLKVALIDLLIPETILQKIFVETAAIAKQKSTNKQTKLKELKDQTPFRNIKNIMDQFKEKRLPNEDENNFRLRKNLLELLAKPLKGVGITSLIKTLCSTDLFEFSGYMCSVGELDYSNMMIVDHETVKAMLKINKSLILPIVIPKELLAKALETLESAKSSTKLRA